MVEQGGDYVLALKGNQTSLYDDVKTFLDDAATPVAQDIRHGKGHGRVETRIAQISGDVDWLQELHDWPGLKAVGKVTATRYLDGTESYQTRTPRKRHRLALGDIIDYDGAAYIV